VGINRSMEMIRDVVIVGGGPAGAVCGQTLATAGVAVTIIDDHLAWEKPCGGGLTQKAIRAYPFLLDGPYPKKVITEVELTAGSPGTARPNRARPNRARPNRARPNRARPNRARLLLDEPLVIYSRQVLNGLLLERAERAGCRIVRARVSALHLEDPRPRAVVAQDLSSAGSNPRPRVVADGTELSADFVVIAAGARNRLLPAAQPLEPADLDETVGYFVPVDSAVLKIKFLPDFRGYLWSFPRPGHLSVGVCGKLDEASSVILRRHLEAYMDEERLPREGARFYSHLLPSPRAGTLRARTLAGPNWALVGDAAAMVDSITGEGIYYAMRSGELCGQALAAGRPGEYVERMRSEFGGELEMAADLAPRFYFESFLGGAVTARTVDFARRSPTFRRLLAALFSGSQDYRTLKRRLWNQLPLSLAEIGWSFISPS
jgi:flavin-dependent dehydrogenase